MRTSTRNCQHRRQNSPLLGKLQRPAIGCLATVAALAVLRGIAIQGWIAPVRIAGPSMAETLAGEHFQISCSDCLFPFRCGAAAIPTTGQVVCPNCGYSQRSTVPQRRGDRVLVDRLAYAFRPPRRGDLVALHAPDGQLSVKRIVGLPGEHLSIRHGDLYIHGHIARKSLEDFRQIATLVHDDRYRPQRSGEIPARWASERHPSHWHRTARGYHFRPAPRSPTPAAGALEIDSVDWLTYRNWRGYATPHPRTQEVPISDHSPYDQSESRGLWAVADVLVTCRLELQPATQLQVRIDDGNRTVRLRLDARRRGELSSDDGTLHAEFPVPYRQKIRLEFGLFDQQAVVAVEGKIVAQYPYVTAWGARKPTARPIGILGSGGSVAVEDLKVYRDLYYLDPNNLGIAWEAPRVDGVTAKQTGEAYLVLGDNSHASADSRHWSQPYIDRRQLRGKVLRLQW